jgi:N-acetyl sugar amidotransferase
MSANIETDGTVGTRPAASAQELVYCTRCVYPHTKPGIVFDADGICSGCRAQELKRQINWAERRAALGGLAKKFRRSDGGFDCLIPISGGKDSHVQVSIAKEELGLNPLCVSVSPQVATEIGDANLANLQKRFGVEVLMLRPEPATAARLTHHGMAKNAWPNWAQDKLIYSWPLRQAIQHRIPLVFMGENHDFEKGGKDLGHGPNAASQMAHSLDSEIDFAEFAGAGVESASLNSYLSPTASLLQEANIEVHWLGYYFDWDSYEIYRKAETLGFQAQPEAFVGAIEGYSGIDDAVVPVNGWLKFVKFGFGVVTETVFNHITYSRLSRTEAVALVNRHDGLLDQRHKRNWLDFAGVDETAFDRIVESFANHDLVQKCDGQWRLRHPAV